jgi:hypothetical protein
MGGREGGKEGTAYMIFAGKPKIKRRLGRQLYGRL